DALPQRTLGLEQTRALERQGRLARERSLERLAVLVENDVLPEGQRDPADGPALRDQRQDDERMAVLVHLPAPRVAGIPVGARGDEERLARPHDIRERQARRQGEALPAVDQALLVAALGDELDLPAALGQQADRARPRLGGPEPLAEDGVEDVLRR